MSSRIDRHDGDDGDASQDIEPPGFIERWSNYLLSRFDDEDPNRYEEPGSRLRKFHREDIPKSYNPRAQKRGADGDAPGQGAPKRPRRRGPEFGVGGLLDGIDDADDADDVDAGHHPPPAGEPPQGVPPAGAPAAAPAAADEGERNWWDVASMAMAI